MLQGGSRIENWLCSSDRANKRFGRGLEARRLRAFTYPHYPASGWCWPCCVVTVAAPLRRCIAPPGGGGLKAQQTGLPNDGGSLFLTSPKFTFWFRCTGASHFRGVAVVLVSAGAACMAKRNRKRSRRQSPLHSETSGLELPSTASDRPGTPAIVERNAIVCAQAYAPTACFVRAYCFLLVTELVTGAAYLAHACVLLPKLDVISPMMPAIPSCLLR